MKNHLLITNSLLDMLSRWVLSLDNPLLLVIWERLEAIKFMPKWIKTKCRCSLNDILSCPMNLSIVRVKVGLTCNLERFLPQRVITTPVQSISIELWKSPRRRMILTWRNRLRWTLVWLMHLSSGITISLQFFNLLMTKMEKLTPRMTRISPNKSKR